MDRLEVEAVRVLEGQLGRVLHDADPLGRIEQVGEAAQERRLAGARLTRDEEVRLGPHHPDEEVGHLGVHPAVGHPVATVAPAGDEVESEPVELADREIRPADRRDDRVDPRAVRHPGIDDGVGDRQLPPGEGGDPLGDLDEFARGAEDDVGRLEPPGPLGEDRIRGVDEDVRRPRGLRRAAGAARGRRRRPRRRPPGRGWRRARVQGPRGSP